MAHPERRLVDLVGRGGRAFGDEEQNDGGEDHQHAQPVAPPQRGHVGDDAAEQRR